MTSTTIEDLESQARSALAGAESELDQAAATSGEKAAELRERARAQLKVAREKLAQAGDKAIRHGKAAARTTDRYVHDHPWRVIAGALAAGVALGLLINRDR